MANKFKHRPITEDPLFKELKANILADNKDIFGPLELSEGVTLDKNQDGDYFEDYQINTSIDDDNPNHVALWIDGKIERWTRASDAQKLGTDLIGILPCNIFLTPGQGETIQKSRVRVYNAALSLYLFNFDFNKLTANWPVNDPTLKSYRPNIYLFPQEIRTDSEVTRGETAQRLGAIGGVFFTLQLLIQKI